MQQNSDRRDLVPLPAALYDLLCRIKADMAPPRDVCGALRSLNDLAHWQAAYIQQLEDTMRESVEIACYACHERRQISSEYRDGQRRLTCGACGYRWRLGVKP